jgi:hypothetical protein
MPISGLTAMQCFQVGWALSFIYTAGQVKSFVLCLYQLWHGQGRALGVVQVTSGFQQLSASLVYDF